MYKYAQVVFEEKGFWTAVNLLMLRCGNQSFLYNHRAEENVCVFRAHMTPHLDHTLVACRVANRSRVLSPINADRFPSLVFCFSFRQQRVTKRYFSVNKFYLSAVVAPGILAWVVCGQKMPLYIRLKTGRARPSLKLHHDIRYSLSDNNRCLPSSCFSSDVLTHVCMLYIYMCFPYVVQIPACASTPSPSLCSTEPTTETSGTPRPRTSSSRRCASAGFAGEGRPPPCT